MSKTHVAVFMGGRSEEHEISMKSGARVAEALDRERYTVTPVVIGRDGQWAVDGAEAVRPALGLAQVDALGVDCAFIALHGPYGEDGRIQGLFDMIGLPYTGSGCASSALAMNKVWAKSVVSSLGYRVATHLALERPIWAIQSNEAMEAIEKDIGFPCVIKAVSQGSSKGVVICDSLLTLRRDMEEVMDVGDDVFVEGFVKGVEVTCSVLDTDPKGWVTPLPLTEICPKSSRFFDYEAKYTPGATEEITPARISEQITDSIMDIAAQVHHAIGCSGWSRSDFIIDDHGPVWIEVNTIPGMTATSLFPQAAAAAGISYEQLVASLVDDAMRRAAVRG